MKKTLLVGAVLAVWSLVMSTQLYVGYRLRGVHIPFLGGFIVQLCHWELWAVAGPLVWRLAHRWPVAQSPRRAALLRHIGTAPIVAASILLLFLLLYHAVIRVPYLSGWFPGFDRSISSTAVFFTAAYFHVELLIYAIVVAVAQAARSATQLRAKEHEAVRLEAALTGARLTALRMQLQPHFLFNTLHTIGSLVLQGQNERAVSLLAELGELLRTTLAHRHTDLAPLRDEIAYLQKYLRIEEARFGDRLTVQWHVDPSTLDALVPPFILQPLVENAFRHGISRRVEHSVLSIGAVRANGRLRISVYNDGPLLAESFRIDNTRGFGLRNVVERLRTRDPAGHLELTNAPHAASARPTGVRATLAIPLWNSNVEAD